MFRKTLVKLTLFNTVLLVLLISVFGLMIYSYEQRQTYQESNQILKKEARQKVQILQSLPEYPGKMVRLFPPQAGGGPQHGPQLLLIWAIYNQNGEKIVSSLDGQQYSTQSVNQFLKKLKLNQCNQIVEKAAVNGTFHILNRKVKVNGKYYIVSEIMDVTTEKNLLHKLALIIIKGIVIGALLSTIVGFFLAKRALQPIEKAWDKQNRFVADASHELRTPLSILQLKIEGLLRQPKRRIQETGEDIGVMLEETRRLSKLVGNLLTLARSDANRLEVILAPLDLKKIIGKVTEPFIEMAEFEEKEFLLDLDNQPLIINGDEQRIHQLLVILLDNAMKFTPRSGKIWVSCKRETKYACLSVSDSGIGINEKDLSHIFERFYQAENSRTGGKGTGLGLSIAEWIVSRHRGRIEAQSKPGVGTTFIVHLPLKKSETISKLAAPSDELKEE
ncbi:MAG: sensor histidine kinase [Sporolactobacillus sp.]